MALAEWSVALADKFLLRAFTQKAKALAAADNGKIWQHAFGVATSAGFFLFIHMSRFPASWILAFSARPAALSFAH
jgi:hypothetical protein